MNKKNIFFVSLIFIGVLAGNAFCAKVQDNFKELKTNIASFAKEDVKVLGGVLQQEQQQAEVLDQVGAKLAKVKQQYPDSTKTIDAVFSAIKDLIARRGPTPEFYAQNLITPLERDLSPALINLRNQNTGAFYATMSVIDVVYSTQRGNASLSDIIDFVDGYLPFEGSRVKDTDYLIYSLTADSYNDAMTMFKYLKKTEPEYTNTIKYVEGYFQLSYKGYKMGNDSDRVNNDLSWAEDASSPFWDLEYILSIQKTLNPRLYGKLTAIINRKYSTQTGTVSIAEMVTRINKVLKMNNKKLIPDPSGILASLDAYGK